MMTILEIEEFSSYEFYKYPFDNDSSYTKYTFTTEELKIFLKDEDLSDYKVKCDDNDSNFIVLYDNSSNLFIYEIPKSIYTIIKEI